MNSYTSGGALLVAIVLCLFQPGTTNQPPSFVNFDSFLLVKEDKPIGSVITTLSASDVDNDEVTFEIIGEFSKELFELKKVDKMSSNVTLKSKLDYEIISEHSVVFQVKDEFNTIQRSMKIFVQDVNDNIPIFLNQPYRAEIPEDTKNGTFIYKVTANDPDSGLWGIVTYSISVGKDSFRINSGSGEVNLEGTLDYEKEKFYQLQIIGADGQKLNSSADLIVNVIDVQDTAPFFLNLPYMGTVLENATIGTPILQITALDGDRGVPNQVTYSFSEGLHEYLNIDPDTGVISVAKALDREDPKVREVYGVLEMKVLTTEVTNDPKGPITATAPVTVSIIDVNDEAPAFEQGAYTATVLENSQARIPISLTPIGTEMIVRDYDQGDNGKFEIFLEKNGEIFDVFEAVPPKALNEANVLIRVKNSSALDFEIVKSFEFEVVAREYLTNEFREGRATVSVTLEDVNDNWPMFENDTYIISLEENAPIDTLMTQITATDKDTGLFGTVKYTLRGGSAYLFRVDENTGEIFVNVEADKDMNLLDREKMDVHFLTLEANDGGGLRNSVQLEVILLDVNDNNPVIARSEYDAYIKENMGTLEREVDIQASDMDLPPNNQIKYSIYEGQPYKNITVDPVSGKITITGPLDYEDMEPNSNGRISFHVVATDGGQPALQSRVPVYLYVEDVNDKVPYFTKSLYTSVVSEDSASGTNVTQVFAKDDDGTEPNNEIIYRIESGAKDKFRMDAQTGMITVESGADLDRDLYGMEYTLKVLAIDRGTPPLTGTTMVTINITDINNKHPVFSPSSRTTRISENTTVNTVFYMYAATDLDETSVLRYSLVDDLVKGEDEQKRPYPDIDYLKGLFGIHSENGSLFVKSELNREEVEEITVTVFVEDINAEKPSKQNNTATLTIVLEDVNDNPPEFIPDNNYHTRLSEASQPGVEVKQVIAEDKDKNSGEIKYYLVDDSEASESFEITDSNRARGVITLKKTIDREKNLWMNLTVRAEDSGIPMMSSLASVYVEIEDVNDNSPVWQTFDSPATVFEDAPLDENVTRVFATDADDGEFGRVSYYITGGSEGKFKIDKNTGEITTAGPLDRESKEQYILTIEARDNEADTVNQRVTPGALTINIGDVNDFVPLFTQDLYVVDDLQENAREGFRVITVTALDEDTGDNGKVEYSIQQNLGNTSREVFQVDANSGEVSVKEALQGHIGWYYITVLAKDKGQPSLENTTRVYFFIEDVNDHKPEIVQPPLNTTIYIRENIPLGSQIFKVLAIDEDGTLVDYNMENAPIGYWVSQVTARDTDEGINGIVKYEFVENPSNINKDWLKFHINEEDGNMTTAAHIDREQQETYYLEIRAYDLGKPSYDDRRTIKIVALDEDDNPPRFDRSKYPPPYKVSVKEEQANIFVANLNIATDPDIGNNSLICYYLVGGDTPYKNRFAISKTTGDLFLEESIDREEVEYVDLVVTASEDCFSGFWDREVNRNKPWNASDTSLLLVRVQIIDVNDNSPKFNRRWFTAGVTRETQFGESVLNLMQYSTDPDEGNNSVMYFSIKPPIRITEPLKTQLRQRGEDDEPFTVGKQDGIIKSNIYFQQNMQGYFEFEVMVDDGITGHFDTANVSVYLLNEDQRVKVIIRGDPSEIGNIKDIFAQFLSNITGAIINVDMIRTHQDSNGRPDDRKTDMFLHAIDPTTGEVLDAEGLIGLIDKNYMYLVDLFKKYNVIEVVKAVVEPMASTAEQDLQLALIMVGAVLGLLLALLVIIFCCCRKKYKRKLKAATAMAFENPNGTIGPRDSDLNRLEMPGTNQHTYEGSNPIWLETYANGFVQEDDTDSKNSLDENSVEPPPTQKTFDEQEMSMEMYNDEFDHFNRVPNGKGEDSDIYLKAALSERDSKKYKKPGTNGVNGVNGINGGMNGVVPNGKVPHVKENGHANGKIPNYTEAMTFENYAYLPESSINNRMVDGLVTSDI